jgi:hypothetical protein
MSPQQHGELDRRDTSPAATLLQAASELLSCSLVGYSVRRSDDGTALTARCAGRSIELRRMTPAQTEQPHNCLLVHFCEFSDNTNQANACPPDMASETLDAAEPDAARSFVLDAGLPGVEQGLAMGALWARTLGLGEVEQPLRFWSVAYA